MDQNNLFTITDIEYASQQSLPKEIFDFLSGGSGIENTLHRNESAFQAITLFPRVMRDVSQCQMDVTLLGRRYNTPIMIAPMGFQRLFHEAGELAVAKAAEALGVNMIMSTMASSLLQDVSNVASLCWFQLYPMQNINIMEKLIDESEKAGYQAIVLTVDVPIMANRLRDKRNAFQIPSSILAVNLPFFEDAVKSKSIKQWTDANFNRSLNWEIISWIKSKTNLPIVVKGILHPEDAKTAMAYGAAAIIVSNHGGRQLDDAPSPIEMLPAIAAMINHQIPILLDGGIRSGRDIFKAIALGADAVLVGRPILWGLSIGGSVGVTHVLNLLKEELYETMQLCGCKSISEICNISPVSNNPTVRTNGREYALLNRESLNT